MILTRVMALVIGLTAHPESFSTMLPQFPLLKIFFLKNSFFKKIYLFHFWLCWVFVAAGRLSLVAASGGYFSLRCAGFSLRWLLLLQSTGSRRAGFSSCSSPAR